MPSEQFQFWLEPAASIIELIGVFAIAFALLRARKADERDIQANRKRLGEPSLYANWELMAEKFANPKYEHKYNQSKS